MNELVVSNFNGNYYLINNSINIQLSISYGEPLISIDYWFIIATRLSDGKTIQVKPLSLDPYKPLNIDLAPLIKSMFKDPSTNTNYVNEISTLNNIESYSFTFGCSFYFDNGGEAEQEQLTTIISDKKFIRGGNIELENNLTIPIGKKLRAVEKLPYWVGYPTAEYTLNENAIFKNPILSNIENKERRIEVGCDGVYLKFLNRDGGFSYWLFESNTKTFQSNNIGLINSPEHKLDLGNDTKLSFQVNSKVPNYFYPLMIDLIQSSLILRYNKDSNTWTQIQNDNNSLPLQTNKKVYDVKLKFKPINYFNGSVVWQ